MSDTWDDYAEGWDTNPDVREYSEKAYSELIASIDINGLRILDFGCGTGQLTEKMSPFANRIVALDSSEKMIGVLRKKNLSNVDLVTGVLTEDLMHSNLFLKTSFDLIVASSVFAFLDDFNRTLKLLKLLLSSEGHLIQWDWKKSEKEPDFGFDYEDIKEGYQQAGLSMISISEPFSLENEHGKMVVIMGIAKNVS